MLSKKEILELTPAEEAVEIAGGKVLMRGLTAKEYGDYERSLVTQGPDGKVQSKPIDGGFRAQLVALCLTDEDGATFTAEELEKVDAGIIGPLYDMARKLCGVRDRDVEELAAAFGSAQLDGSSTE